MFLKIAYAKFKTATLYFYMKSVSDLQNVKSNFSTWHFKIMLGKQNLNVKCLF